MKAVGLNPKTTSVTTNVPLSKYRSDTLLPGCCSAGYLLLHLGEWDKCREQFHTVCSAHTYMAKKATLLYTHRPILKKIMVHFYRE